MKYLMLINHGGALADWGTQTPEEQKALYAAWAELNATPGVTPGERMADASDATTVRADASGAALITDGPYAELKDAVAGYFFVEADDLDAAIAVAQKVPSVKHGGSVEIRPLVEQSW